MTVEEAGKTKVHSEHTEDRPFCESETCQCRQDREKLATLALWYVQGLIGPMTFELIYQGKTV